MEIDRSKSSKNLEIMGNCGDGSGRKFNKINIWRGREKKFRKDFERKYIKNSRGGKSIGRGKDKGEKRNGGNEILEKDLGMVMVSR